MSLVQDGPTSTQVARESLTCCCYRVNRRTSDQVVLFCTRNKFGSTPRQVHTHLTAGKSGASVQGVPL